MFLRTLISLRRLRKLMILRTKDLRWLPTLSFCMRKRLILCWRISKMPKSKVQESQVSNRLFTLRTMASTLRPSREALQTTTTSKKCLTGSSPFLTSNCTQEPFTTNSSQRPNQNAKIITQATSMSTKTTARDFLWLVWMMSECTWLCSWAEVHRNLQMSPQFMGKCCISFSTILKSLYSLSRHINWHQIWLRNTPVHQRECAAVMSCSTSNGKADQCLRTCPLPNISHPKNKR